MTKTQFSLFPLDKLSTLYSVACLYLYCYGGVMLNAQLQFDNWDFETSGLCLGKNGSYAKIADWEEISPSGDISDGIGHCFDVCDGERSLVFDWGCLTNNPMFGNPSTNPYTVTFLCTVTLNQSKPETIYKVRAYGRHTKNGSDTYLGEVDVSDDENCVLKSITMPSNVSDFEYFVLRVEDYVIGLNCKIDNIEIDNSLCSRKFPSYTIRHDTEWNTIADVAMDVPDAILNGEVYLSGLNIAEGKKLTIGGDITIHFSEGALLLMWGGSKLDLYGKLTSCDNFWGGVRTYSNSYFRSFWRSEIRNAVWGISSEEWGNYLGSATIECRDTRFINNAVAIHLYGPSTSQNGYQFLLKNCGFIKDANYNPTRRFWGFISLNNMDTRIGGSGIYGCLFDNQNPTNTFNFGIEAYDSDFLVNSLNGNNTVFRNLGYGIFATRRSAVWSYDVRNTDFNDCAVGIGNRRISSSIIARCNFNMGNLNPIYDGLLCCLGLNLQVGVSNNGVMTNLAIENNTFQSATQGLWTQGVNNYNVGTADNLVYSNSFTNLRHGNSAGNGAGLTNAQPNNGSGLYYLCNSNQNNINSNLQWEYDFYARDLLSVRMNQGDVAPQGNFAAARNTFSPGFGARHFDNISPAYTVNYFALQNTPVEIPTEISNTVVTQTLLDNGCAAHFFKTDDPSEKMSQTEKEENESQYKNNWDAANTVKSEINAAKQSGNVALIKKKRGQYLYYRQLFEQAANKGLRNALLEKQGNDRSEIRMWLKRMDNQSADLLLVDDYIASGELEVAMNILDNMELKYDLTNAEIIDLENMRKVYATIGLGSVDEMDQASLGMLKEMAATKGQAAELAKSILGARGAYYPQIIVKSSDEGFNGGSSSDETSVKMSVSPNPADYLVTFDWSIFDTAGKTVRIEITNKMGALVKVLESTDNATALNWTTEAVSDGICYYRLLIDNQVVDSGHIFITK